MQINGYDLSRTWFDFCYENPEKISPTHTAMYFFAIEHCNRLGWKEKFGFPTTMVMEAIGIKSYNTYKKVFNDLINFGFIILIQKSINQYSSNIIALSKNNKALDKALDKALIKHSTKHSESTIESIDSIIKQLTSKQLNKEQLYSLLKILESNNFRIIEANVLDENKTKRTDFSLFWNLYNKKVGDKKKCQKKWDNLSIEVQQNILDSLPKFTKQFTDKQFQPFPETYLNQERWNDEILIKELIKEVSPYNPSLKPLVIQ